MCEPLRPSANPVGRYDWTIMALAEVPYWE